MESLGVCIKGSDAETDKERRRARRIFISSIP
jgi:hypothetical protein